MKTQRSKYLTKNYLKELIRLVILTALVGLVLSSFFKLSIFIDSQRGPFYFLPLLFPLLLWAQTYTKNHFRTVAKSVNAALIPNSSTKVSSLYAYLFTLLGYICGTSVGREGACVIIAEGFKPKHRLSKLNWKFILASMGFAGALGSVWLGPLFYLEVYVLNFKNRIALEDLFFIFLGSAGVCWLMEKYQVIYFHFAANFEPLWLNDKNFYITILSLVFFIGFSAMVFKKMLFSISEWIHHQPFRFKLFLAACLGGILIVPKFQIFQGLGLKLVNDSFSSSGTSAFIAFGKLLVTVLSLSLGFLGGEFVPAVIVGSKLGQVAAWSNPSYVVFASALGFFMFFSCITNLFWISILACTLHFGWQVGLIFALVAFVAQKISGKQSVYFHNYPTVDNFNSAKAW